MIAQQITSVPDSLKKYSYDELTAIIDKKWKKVSDHCMDFIDKCLIKEPEKRATTSELLKHPWILKYYENGK